MHWARWALVLGIGGGLTGCSEPVVVEPVLISTPAVTHPPQYRELQRTGAMIAFSLERLRQMQEADGSWRSRTYGLMKDGNSLTAFVALAEDLLSASAQAYVARLAQGGEAGLGKLRLIYPVYTAADAVRLLGKSQYPVEYEAWREYLLGQQLDESLGWQPEDLEYGGWSYALAPPHRPGKGQQRGAWDWSNISATRYALAALRGEGMSSGDPVCARALVFIQRCQNEDGGFCFSCADEIHNKAGTAGRDETGRLRFNSYGSATVDGYAALRLCGLGRDDPRVARAAEWLLQHHEVKHNPGAFAAGNEDIRDATYFYYCRGLAWFCLDGGHAELAGELRSELWRRRDGDAMWRNRFTDAREDDPIVATVLAVEAMRDCGTAMFNAVAR